MGVKKLVALVAALAVIASLVVGSLAAAMFALLAYLTGAAEEAYLNSCTPDGRVATGPAYTGKKFLSPEQVAATVYSQSIGLGMGETGALIGIAAGLAESSLNNGGRGDLVSSNYRQFRIGNKYASPGMMTDSRGVFQARQSWVPPNLAWSGMKFTYENSERVYSDANPITGDKDVWNPWKGVGWANSDPRMNHPQSAATFLLGGFLGQPGLEEAFARDKRIKKTGPVPAPEVFTDYELGEFAQYVQRSGPNKYASRMPEARAFLERIRSGEISVPPFTPPASWLKPSTPRTQVALRVSGVAVSPASPSGAVATASTPQTETPVLQGDGVTVIGDSVMKHTAAVVKMPTEMFGGPVVHHSMVGISLGGVLSGKDVRASDSSRDPQGRKATPTSEWIRSIAEGPSRIIVQLGTNGGGTKEQVDQFMTLAGPNREVFWWSQHYGPSQPFNKVLLEASTRYPNLNIVDISSVPGLDVTSRSYHPWEGLPAKSDPTKEMWSRMMAAIAGGGEPNFIKSLACGGLGLFVGDVEAATAEGANAALWALKKERQGTGYVAAANPGNPDGNTYDCSTFVFTALSQAGYEWTMKTSSNQWADEAHIQLIPASLAQAGDLIWSNWGAGDTASGGVAGHVAIIVGVEDGVPVAVGAENPTKGVARVRLDEYKPSNGFLGLKNPNAPRGSATDPSNVNYSQNWQDAYVGRIIGGSPIGSAATTVASSASTVR